MTEQLPFYEIKFREYLKKYHPKTYEELIFKESQEVK